MVDKDKKVKVPFRFNSKGYDQSGQEYIELENGGSDGYDDGKEFMVHGGRRFLSPLNIAPSNNQ